MRSIELLTSYYEIPSHFIYYSIFVYFYMFVYLWSATCNCPSKQIYEKILSTNIYPIIDKKKGKAVDRMLLGYSWKPQIIS